jgi:uncharacterized Zn finger protein
MGKQARKTKSSSRAAARPSPAWTALTWAELDSWAGARSVARGRTYARQGRVKNLSISAEDRLLATVTGGERYVTSVWLGKGKRKAGVHSECTCPVGDNGCKHAVAVVAVYLQALVDQTPVAAAETDDPRWEMLRDRADALLDDDDFDEDDFDQDFDEDDVVVDMPKRRRSVRSSRPNRDGKIREFMQRQSPDELVNLLMSAVDRFPELRAEFENRIALTSGDVPKLVKQARSILRKVTDEIGWEDRWGHGGGHTPDYSELRRRLEHLLESGHADEVVELGKELIERGMSQIEQSHDDGETGVALASCTDVVFRAVAASKLAPKDKILYAIDACMSDDYDLLSDGVETLIQEPWSSADWSKVADELRRRLEAVRTVSTDSFHSKHHRNGLSNWLLTALRHADRDDESLALLESEARTAGSYRRLVDHLIEAGRFDDAERWAHEGIEVLRSKEPGTAASLAGRLCELAGSRGQWAIVAAHAGLEFLEQPSRFGFEALLKAARKAKCEKEVRNAALKFLETGQSPILWSGTKTKPGTVTMAADWPLPLPAFLKTLLEGRTQRARLQPGAHFPVLMQIAMAEKRPADVLIWYDRIRADRRGSNTWDSAPRYAGEVAAAVAESHPDRALKLYAELLDAVLAHAHQAAYEEVAATLKKMRPIMERMGQADAWPAMLLSIRLKYGNRPRLMDALDRVEGKTIVESVGITKKRKGG